MFSQRDHDFAVDVASLICNLDRSDRDTACQFITKTRYRKTYGPDFTLGQGLARGSALLRSVNEREWNFFAGAAEDWLPLPESALKKRTMPCAWIPGSSAG